MRAELAEQQGWTAVPAGSPGALPTSQARRLSRRAVAEAQLTSLPVQTLAAVVKVVKVAPACK